MAKRVRQLKLHEFFLCDFDRDTFLSALQGVPQASVAAKIDEFSALKLFAQDPFQVLQEHLIEKLAHGPDRRQVTLKQPDTSIYFMHLNQQDANRALEQAMTTVQKSNEYWTATVSRWMDEAMENSRGTMRYFKL